MHSSYGSGFGGHFIDAHKKFSNGPKSHEHVVCAEKARDIFAELRNARWHNGTSETRRRAGKKHLRQIAKRAAARLVYDTDRKPRVTTVSKSKRKK